MRDKDSSGHSSHNDVVRAAFWMPLSLLLGSTSTPPAPPDPPTRSMERRNFRKRSNLPRHCLFVFYSFHRGFPTFSDTGSYYKRLATSALLCTKCCSKGSHHAFAKFLNPRNTHNSNPPPLPPQPLPFSLPKPPVPASTSSKNIRRSINLVCVDSCLRIHSQNERSSSKTHRYVFPKFLPKMILLLHLSAICLSLDCRPRRVPPLQLLEILPHPAHGRFSVHSRRLLNAVTSSTFFATSSPNLVTASCLLSALFPPMKRTPQPATEKSGTSVSDELVLLDFFNLLLSRLSFRSPFLFAPATHRLAVADQISLLLSTPLLILPLSSPLPCLLTLPLLFPCSTLISP